MSASLRRIGVESTWPTNASTAQSSQVVTRHCPNGVVAFALIETVGSLRESSAL